MANAEYQALCNFVREQTHATGAIVIVLRGAHGSGYATDADTPMLPILPGILRDIATQIDKEQGTGKERRHGNVRR